MFREAFRQILPMSFASFVVKLIVLISSVANPGCAILTKQLQFPPSSSSSGGVGGTSVFGQQSTGILTGPSPSWSPNEYNLNYYLNLECQTDNDCYPSRTILYCISYRCQCITSGATYLNGFFYNYNMEWSQRSSQCISQSGSPCTLKQFRNAPGVVNMECVQGHECVEVNSPAAKATIAASTPTGFGSSVSVQQMSSSGSQQQQPREYYHNVQYFGSGVSSLTGTMANQRQNGGTPISASASSSSSSSVTTADSNTWGICVRRSGGGDQPYLGHLNDRPNSGSSGSGSDFGLSLVISCLLAMCLVGLNIS